ncbi:hypothetical protein F4825DRAFT_472107 [Nemania diffusa]|nr:hypothetical protein F4825DRAFT_472107 [Nemania diffusa]
MAYGGDLDVDEVMVDDGLVSDNDGVTFGLSEDEKEEVYIALQPKIPFAQRANPFVGPKDEKFQKIEDYFFYLLNSSELTVEDILEGTFDAHEISLITPQSEPSDIVQWQHRNARRYYENLETRFKGHPDTLAFKMACLYFGFPVEPLRTGTMSFDLPLDSDPTGTEGDATYVDPLAFLKKYEFEAESVDGETILSLRGGGGRGYAVIKEKDDTVSWVPATKSSKGRVGQAIQEISPEGYEMDFNWEETPLVQPQAISLYGWQGVVSSPLRYYEFVAQVDRLLSNWNHIDRHICVEIWSVSPVKLRERVTGPIYHSSTEVSANDPIWNVVQKYFQLEGEDKYACFIRMADEDPSTDGDRPGGYQPSSSDKYVIQIENESTGDVAYMRVPNELYPEHKPHQFSTEYTLAMKALLSPEAPHAWVSYHHDLAGSTYQELDPPGGLWDQVIAAQSDWSDFPTISFSTKDIASEIVPVIVPGVFRPGQQPQMHRRDFRRTGSTSNSGGLGKLYGAIESSMGNSSWKSECNGFEVWCSGNKFKEIRERPLFIRFSGSIMSPASFGDWNGVLASGSVPKEPFCLVARPVYKTYRLQKPDSAEEVNLQINQCDVKRFKALVHKRLYGDYDPKDPSQVILLSPADQDSYQPELTIRWNTTEDEWHWIRRNVIEPNIVVTIQPLGNEWQIPRKTQWGPRYVDEISGYAMPTPSRSKNPASSFPDRYTGKGQRVFAKKPGTDDGLPGASPRKKAKTDATNQEPIDLLFKDSSNTIDEAARTRILRDHSFTNTSSIFTNPLKPVMPLEGPPLESIIKTGPAMPGVSIAMMTPTEMLKLQREVHSLRYQLLDRTRECPYADCERYFTFSDAKGLDQHIREDHSVLRCFLCDKKQFLLPYYNTEQIKEHFVTEHVADILKSFGGLKIKEQRPRERPPVTFAEEASHSSDSESGQSPLPATTPAPKPNWQELFEPSHRNPEPAPAETEQDDIPDWEAAVGESKTPQFDIFTARQTKAGNSQENIAWIDNQLKRYAEQGGKLVPFPDTQATGHKAQATEPAADAAGGERGGSSGGKRKRKRPVDLDAAAYQRRTTGSGSDDYEYSERSAVTDPVAELDPAAAAAAAAKTADDHPASSALVPPPPTPVAFTRTRTGRAVRPTRAAREAAENAGLSTSTTSSSEDS